MTTRAVTTLVSAGIASILLASSSQAGGFNRGIANLDPLYYTTGFGLTSSVTYVSPARSFSSVSGARIVGGRPGLYTQGETDIVEDFTVPSVTVGGRIIGDLSCAGSYTQPYGVEANYDGAIRFNIAQQKLDTDEYGLTCGYGFDLSKGRLLLIGGVFYETVDFTQARDFTQAFPFPFAGESRIRVESEDFGYRLGVGYEIPEIALKAQLLYRSETHHDATGDYTNTPFAVLTSALSGGRISLAAAQAIYGNSLTASASTSATLPQNLEFSLQSGIAPGWLAFGSVKWTDWSVLKRLQVVEGIAGQTFSSTNFYFEDGWTVTGGVGHKFNDKLGGSLSVTWDKGVSTGWDTLTDTWSFGGGVAYDFTDKFQLRAGGAAIYFTDGDKDKVSSALDYTATSDNEWGYALSLSGTLKF
ncbi:OmpP1/FadL family transporter [Tianweitania populi]|uniref:Long-chain fatty acid transporter n=1 Tax=Tianweitania populi TaxID=1607949 RepID=A0A8J3GJG8_9HYPH|nr:outer membrane protein transport protein [Tianweitania populi]GHD06705.1 long-chain fatty acid transporter [Tianweitania populi]